MKSIDGRRIAFSGIDLRFMVDETDGKGEMVMFEMSVLPDARVPIAHHHVAVDEAIVDAPCLFVTIIDRLQQLTAERRRELVDGLRNG